MPIYICRTCGVEHAESAEPPASCIICDDERQYVGWDGQRWTTREELLAAGHRNELRELEPGLTGIGITPSFSIGQRALLVQSEAGNVLYDCVSLLDDEARAQIEELGGIAAITLSHPHFYDAMVSWSHAFGDCPVYVPEADRDFVTRPDPVIRYWDGAPIELVPGVSLIRTGGHFPGSAVLHWAAGSLSCRKSRRCRRAVRRTQLHRARSTSWRTLPQSHCFYRRRPMHTVTGTASPGQDTW